MKPVLGVLIAILVSCGHSGAGGLAGDGSVVGVPGDVGDGSGNDGSLSSTDAIADAGGATTDGNATTDGGTTSSSCADPIAPSVTFSVSSPSYGGVVFRAGSQIYASSILDPAHQWLRWTGAQWNADPIPWPSNVPSVHPNYISRVVPLASGRALIVTDSYWLMTYDGVTMSPAIAPAPTPSQEMWGYAVDASGAYHVFWGNEEWISKSDGTWYPPAPVPIHNTSLTQGTSTYDQGAAAVMADGRIVVLYLDDKFNAPARHGWVTSHDGNGTWSQAIDITPAWAVNAQDPQLYAPPDGGIVASLVGASNNYNLAAVWRSSTGTSFGNYEQLPGGAPPSLSGECLDSLVASEVTALYRSHSTGWDALAGAPAGVVAYHAEVAARPDGKVFWVVGGGSGTDYLVSP